MTVATVGQGVPADYRAVLDETPSRPVTINGSVLFTGVDEVVRGGGDAIDGAG